MSSPKGKPASKMTAQKLDWQICEDERAWEVAQSQAAPSFPPEMRAQRWTRGKLMRLSALIAGIVLSLALVGGWLWQRAQTGLVEIESELEGKIVSELWHGGEARTPAEKVEAKLLSTVALSNDPGEIVTQVEIRDLGSDWAVVEVAIQPRASGPTYRQTRVYYERESGWVRGEVVATYWGAARQLESEYFVIQYRALDEAAVMQAALQLDALYLDLHNILYPELPVGEKLTITIDPEYLRENPVDPSGPQAGIVVASPSATLAPAALAASDLLLQSIVLEMYEWHTFDLPTNQNSRISWFRVQRGLRLWFIWDHDLPLAVWRKPLVKWLLEAAEDAARQTDSAVPPFAKELCAYHSLWMSSPLKIEVPILCWDEYPGDEKISVWPSPQTIAQISPGLLLYAAVLTTDSWSTRPEVRLWQPAYAVILATVFEYAASHYGREQIPRLLAAIPEHRRAETLIPDVFGVPLAEFERGWRAYIVEQYEINPSSHLRVVKPTGIK